MNKRLNGIFFLITATLMNIIIMIVFTMVPLFLFWHFFAKSLDQVLAVVISIVILTGAIVGTWATYKTIMVAIEKRFDLDRYFDSQFLSFFRKRR